ncbi:hypothetical protein PFISCL1PPCAC_14728, partial [Pristionchus fissidentatus]
FRFEAMVHYKLYYFPSRSVAEPVRQMFAYAGVEYEDIRITKEEWLAEWKNKMAFDQVPVLEVDGKQLPQSLAIGRFVAKQYGFYGKTPFEAAWIDAIADQFKDYWVALAPWFYVHMGYMTGDAESARAKHTAPARDMLFPHLQKKLQESTSGFLVGDQVSWVDFMIQEHVTVLEEEYPGFLKDYPELCVHAAKIRALPAIKSWIERRPVSRG